MNEKPLERLNYFNGQRLEATDFKLEQDYHVRVRRWLNRSLHTAGIASGLEVYAIEGAPKVRVLPGLAIDMYGREIILLEEQVVDVVGQHNGPGYAGPYLTIRYQEEIISQSTDNCIPCGRSGNKPAEKGPARILADAVLELNADLPNAASGKVALACVALAKGCGSIDFIDTGVRRYIGDASAATVKQYALEGTREVAALPNPAGGNPLRVRPKILFHVRGRQPNSVTLYLKARELSPLHYTEIGTHTHGLTIDGSTQGPSPALDDAKTSHFHANDTLKAQNDATSQHLHSFTARRGYIGNSEGTNGVAAVFLIERSWGVQLGLPNNTGNVVDDIGNSIGNALTNIFQATPCWAPETDTNSNQDILGPSGGVIGGGGHEHTIVGQTAPKGVDLTHTHSVSGSGTSDPFGSTSGNPAVVGRMGTTLTYFHDLKIAVDDDDQTTAILRQISLSTPGNQAWQHLGDGTGTHPLSDEQIEAVAVRIDLLPGVTLAEGEHAIEFSVDLYNGTANGGVVQFNLYVE